jgi:hypothetical protein
MGRPAHEEHGFSRAVQSPSDEALEAPEGTVFDGGTPPRRGGKFSQPFG